MKVFAVIIFRYAMELMDYTGRNNWWRTLQRDQCLAIVAVQMRAAHNNLQRQNTMYSHKKYVILEHLLLMRLIVDTRWAEGAKRLCFTCSSVELLRPRPLAIPN